MRLRAVWFVLLLLLPGFVPQSAGAQAPAPTGRDADQVRLSLDRYTSLLRGANGRGGPQGQWARGTLSISLPAAGGQSATVTFDGRVTVPAGVDGPLEVPLLPAEVALNVVTVNGDDGALSRGAGMHLLVFSGAATLHAEYTVPVLAAADGGAAVVVPVPPVPSAAVSISGGTGHLEAFPLSGATGGEGSLTGTLPAAQALVIRMGGSDAGGLRRVEYSIRPDATGDGVDVVATYEVLVGGTAENLVLEPADVALADLREGAAPLTPRVEDEHHVLRVAGKGRHTVVATWRLAADRSQGQPQVALHPAGAPMTRVAVELEGKRQVSVEPPVPIRTAQRGNATVATADLPPGDEVKVSWTETRDAPESQARTNTETYQLLTLAEGVLRSRVLVRSEVIRGKLKDLALLLPEDVVVYKVVGEGVRDWQVFAKAADAPRLVRIFFAREMDGDVNVEVQLEMRAPQTPGSELALPVLRPLGAFREMGVVALCDGDKVGFGPTPPGTFTAVGEDALPSEVRATLTDKVSQAFKHVGEPGSLTSKVVAATTREVRFDARVQTLYQVKEGSLVANAQVMVELKSGRRDHVLISLPDGVAEPRINAPSLNKVEAVPPEALPPELKSGPGALAAGRKVWDVRFTQALEGAIQLDVEAELLLPKELGEVSLPDVRVHGAEVEEGSIALTTETGMEVQPGAVSELRRVEVKELPNALTLRSPNEIVLGYHFVHAPWSLALSIKRHQTVETLNASADRAWIESAVLENGHVVTRALWAVTNDDKQFMRIALPKESRVLTVRIGGEPVRAVADESGAVAIPLPKGKSVVVEIAFENVRGNLGWLGRLALEAPHPDMRISDVQWLVCSPSDVSILGTFSDLKTQPGYAYRRPDSDPPNRAACDAPFTGGAERSLYTWPVEDAGDAPLRMTLIFTGAGGESFATVLTLLVLGCLGGFMWRRSEGRRDRGTFAMLGAGLTLLLLLALVGGLSFGRGGFVAVALFALAVLVRRRSRAPAPVVDATEPPVQP